MVMPLQATYDIVKDGNYDIVMSYDNLMLLQSVAEIAALLLFLGGLLVLALGLIRPGWIRLSRRIWAIPIAIVLWFVAIGVFGAMTAFTHSQPNGPHAFEAYMDALTAKMCVTQPEHQDCKDLRTKCERRDPTHPPCRILAGEDPRKFYSN